MKVELWAIGKTNERYLEEGIALYKKRLKHYLPFEWVILPDVKAAGAQLKEREGELVLSRIKSEDWLALLDEKGQLMGSEAFAAHLDKRLQQSHRRLIFLIGGAYGFSPAVYQRANEMMSLSPMTFSHQMVRVFFLEQLYRAMTILRHEPYHNG